MFDKYIGIDWSGASSVYTKSIAVACLNQNSNRVDLVRPVHHTRWSRDLVCRYIMDLAKGDQRVFIGVDACLGYAHHIAQQQIPDIKHAVDLWEFIDSYCLSDQNYYAGSFWKHPDHQKFFWERGQKKIGFDLAKRETEVECYDQKIGAPESPFKLIGPKQVGKGGMSAMRMMWFLKQALKHHIAFWPFDHQDDIDQAKIVIGEIYPRLFIKKAGFGLSKITDFSQINTILDFYSACLTTVPENYSDHQADAIISVAGIRDFLSKNQLTHTRHPRLRVEGWILGVQPSRHF